MSTLRHPVSLLARFALVGGLFAAPAYADQLVYVPLSQPCRLLDTRGSGALTAASGSHLFGTSKTDIVAQHGNPEGCAIPAGVQAVSVNMNMLNATAPGNISTWSASAGPTAPNIGTAVYNPTVGSPSPGQVQYNTGYTSVPLGAAGGSNGRFYLQVANGQIDMTINAVGYWLPISISEIRSGAGAVALGLQTTASGFISTAMGENTTASGNYSTALGGGTTASGYMSTAMGVNTTASGSISTAMGASTTASGDYSTAMGDATVASGLLSTAMGSAVDTAGHKGSFIYGDSVHSGAVGNSHDDQFTVVAEGGVQFFTGEDPVSHALAHGVELAPGGGSWTTISDRNAKTAVQPVDAREVLKKVAALPLNTCSTRHRNRSTATWARWRRTSTLHSNWAKPTRASIRSMPTAWRSRRFRDSTNCWRRRTRKLPPDWMKKSGRSSPCAMKKTARSLRFAKNYRHRKRRVPRSRRLSPPNRKKSRDRSRASPRSNRSQESLQR